MGVIKYCVIIDVVNRLQPTVIPEGDIVRRFFRKSTSRYRVEVKMTNNCQVDADSL